MIPSLNSLLTLSKWNVLFLWICLPLSGEHESCCSRWCSRARACKFYITASITLVLTLTFQSDLEEVDNDIKAVNRLLLRADAFCLSNSTCPFHDQGRGAVPKVDFHNLIIHKITLSYHCFSRLSRQYSNMQSLTVHAPIPPCATHWLLGICVIRLPSPFLERHNTRLFLKALNLHSMGIPAFSRQGRLLQSFSVFRLFVLTRVWFWCYQNVSM